ncbi:MAG: pyruvate dehydrogenase (acetyl-transferring) E1 component subunit alpha [Planctomycetes bacterium]|nr:pyruvate dehydrogenase (acetyl-transferring) E1 component subunit alpha [Planctomycetota bacterium]
MDDAPATASLTRVAAHEILRNMLRIRRLEEKSAELYSQGKIRGFLHLYIGEEAVAVGAIPLLTSDDAIVATYREHGHALIRGMSAGSILAEMYGKSNGCCRGRGGSMHLFDAGLRFYGGNAIVAGGLPLAVGLALADKLQQRPRVTVCLFGDGAVDEGEFHESLNLAALWKLPVLFLCENNLYAMGTALERHESQTKIFAKADAYGIASAAVDGMVVLGVRNAMRTAIDYVRQGQGPYLLEARTYRFRAHSMYDAELYRSHEEVDEWKHRDPIQLFTALLTSSGLLESTEVAAMELDIAEELAQAVATAEAGAWEPVTDLYKDVYTCPA